MFEEIVSEAIGIVIFLFLIGCPLFLLLHIFTRKRKPSLMMENNEPTNDPRLYWKQTKLAFQLSKEQRKEITEKFLKLVERGKKGNVERMSKIMKEKNRLLPFVVEEMRQKPEM